MVRQFHPCKDTKKIRNWFAKMRILSAVSVRSRSVGRKNAVRSCARSFFFISLFRVRNSGPLDYIGNLVNFIGKVIKHISCCYGVPAPGLARDMIPTSERRGLYVLIFRKAYQSPHGNNATVVRVFSAWCAGSADMDQKHGNPPPPLKPASQAGADKGPQNDSAP